MEELSDIKVELIAELHNAIQTASRDYFIWTKGSIIYDHGVEALMQVYAAKRLFDLFAPQYGLEVHMEESLAGLTGVDTPRKSGRIDLTLRFDNGPHYFIEFKRYTNEANLRDDLERLKSLTEIPGRVGLLAAPCYIKRGEKLDLDWPQRFADQFRNSHLGLEVHLSERRSLPSRFAHPRNWFYDRALIIEINSPIIQI